MGIGNEVHELVLDGVHSCEVQRGLARMFDRALYTGEQRRSAFDRLQASAWLGRAAIPTPPVVDQSHGPRTDSGLFNVLGRESSTARVVFEFIKNRSRGRFGPVMVVRKQPAGRRRWSPALHTPGLNILVGHQRLNLLAQSGVVAGCLGFAAQCQIAVLLLARHHRRPFQSILNHVDG